MTVEVFGLRLAEVHLRQRKSRCFAARRNGQVHSRGGGGVHGGHGGGGRLVQRRVVHPGVVPAALGLGQQETLLSGLPRVEEGLAGVALAVSQGLGERLETRLGQQENADDADKGAAGEDDVVKEIALLIVELHDGSSQHAEPGARQYQADATPSAITQKMLLHYYIVQKKKADWGQVLQY